MHDPDTVKQEQQADYLRYAKNYRAFIARHGERLFCEIYFDNPDSCDNIKRDMQEFLCLHEMFKTIALKDAAKHLAQAVRKMVGDVEEQEQAPQAAVFELDNDLAAEITRQLALLPKRYVVQEMKHTLRTVAARAYIFDAGVAGSGFTWQLYADPSIYHAESYKRHKPVARIFPMTEADKIHAQENPGLSVLSNVNIPLIFRQEGLGNFKITLPPCDDSNAEPTYEQIQAYCQAIDNAVLNHHSQDPLELFGENKQLVACGRYYLEHKLKRTCQVEGELPELVQSLRDSVEPLDPEEELLKAVAIKGGPKPPSSGAR